MWGKIYSHTHLVKPGYLCTKQALRASAGNLLELGLGTCRRIDYLFSASFKQQTQSLIDTLNDFDNPFEDDCPELLVLNTRVCADDSVVETVRSLKALGITKYQEYKKEVITDRTKSIHDAVKKNSLALFSSPKRKVKVKSFW